MDCRHNYDEAQAKLQSRAKVKEEIANRLDYKEIGNTKFAAGNSIGTLPY